MGEEILFCARYPFSKAAKEYFSQHRLSLTPEVLEHGKARARAALEKGYVPLIVGERIPSLEGVLASYASCRMLLSVLKNRYLINRYAVAESKTISHYYLPKEKDENIARIAAELGLSFVADGSGFLIPLIAYLRSSPRSVDYRLINRKVKDGFVHIKASERIRLIEEAIRKSIESSLPISAPSFPKEVVQTAEQLREFLPKQELSVKLDASEFPACIQKIIDDLRMSVNVPHTARLALAIYLVNAGMPIEDIVKLYSSAPDFDEKVTRYQIDYIVKKGYSTPSCSTMDTWGLRCEECTCNGMGIPTKYAKKVQAK